MTTNHTEFVQKLTPELLNKHDIQVVVDGKNCLDKAALVTS